MQRILVLAAKDLRLISRDRLGLFFMLIFPIFMALFFGSIMGGVGQKGSSPLNVVVVDEDQSDMSKMFVQSIESNDAVDVQQLGRDEAVERVRKGGAAGVIILPEGFGQTAGIFWAESPGIDVGLDPSRKAESGMLQGMIMQSMGQLTMSRFQDPDSLKPLIESTRAELENDKNLPPAMKPVLLTLMSSLTGLFDSLEAVQHQEENIDATQSPMAASGGFDLARIRQIDVSRKPEPGSQEAVLQNVRSGWDISFPQSMVWGILACVAGFATLIVREQMLGTQTRLLVAPVTRPQLLIGKGVACFACLVIVLLTMTLIAAAMGMRPRRWDLLLLAVFSIGVCFVGLMLPLSLLGRTEQAVSGAVWGVCTVMAMFGGGMMPVIFMPKFVQQLSNFDPVKWAVYSMEGAIWRGFTFQEMLLPSCILIGIGIVAACLGSVLISRRAA